MCTVSSSEKQIEMSTQMLVVTQEGIGFMHSARIS